MTDTIGAVKRDFLPEHIVRLMKENNILPYLKVIVESFGRTGSCLDRLPISLLRVPIKRS